MTPYTPPEPVQIDKHIPSGYVIRGYTEAQLRSEVERVRREAVEECASLATATVCDTHIPTGIKIYGTRAGVAIRSLK